jgi:hypothetical protein
MWRAIPAMTAAASLLRRFTDAGVRAGPEPDDITLEAYGRAIPEA